jgi:hypothetical protein
MPVVTRSASFRVQTETNECTYIDCVEANLCQHFCIFCQTNIERGTELPIGQCGHVFHPSCLIENLRRGNTACPICRDDPYTVVDRAPNMDIFPPFYAPLDPPPSPPPELQSNVDIAENPISYRDALKEAMNDTSKKGIYDQGYRFHCIIQYEQQIKLSNRIYGKQSAMIAMINGSKIMKQVVKSEAYKQLQYELKKAMTGKRNANNQMNILGRRWRNTNARDIQKFKEYSKCYKKYCKTSNSLKGRQYSMISAAITKKRNEVKKSQPYRDLQAQQTKARQQICYYNRKLMICEQKMVMRHGYVFLS